jgi:hypothetical protein
MSDEYRPDFTKSRVLRLIARALFGASLGIMLASAMDQLTSTISFAVYGAVVGASAGSRWGFVLRRPLE